MESKEFKLWLKYIDSLLAQRAGKGGIVFEMWHKYKNKHQEMAKSKELEEPENEVGES